jgi:5-oxoprolinase (ATP-hydrolysing) subunit A
MKVVDINCDMGESFGAYKIGSDEEMMKFITSANIACGFHAGDPMVMDRTVKMAVENGVNVGCHPGYPDLMGFGRRVMDLSPLEIENYVLYQLGALWAFCKVHKTEMRHVKPHGAISNRSWVDLDVAQALARGIARFSKDLPVFSIANVPFADACQEMGLKVIEEFYPERGYNADGTLQSRKMPGSSIHDPQVAVERALKVVREGIVIAWSGETVKVGAQTICIHGDNPAAPRIAAAMTAALKAEGIEIKPL